MSYPQVQQPGLSRMGRVGENASFGVGAAITGKAEDAWGSLDPVLKATEGGAVL